MKYKYIIIGNSRSGKSTVGKTLAESFNGTFLDVVDYVLRFIKKNNLIQSEFGADLLKGPYEDLCRDLAKGKKWDVLEIASDYPEEFLPKIISTTKFPTKLIFCNCPLDVCLKRNKKCKRVVPVETIKNQNKHDESYYRDLAKNLKIQLIVLDSTQPPAKVFQNLLYQLKELF